MTKPVKQWDQDLPPWVRAETIKQQRKPPAPRARATSAGPTVPAKRKLTPAPEPQRLHVRVEFAGSIEFILEGDEANEIRVLLVNGAGSEEILDALDPWASGAKVHQEVRVVEEPDRPSEPFYCWAVHGERGAVEGRAYGSEVNPFHYSASWVKPHAVNWRLVR